MKLIADSIHTEVLAQLNRLAQEQGVTIISAIESGSRAWGFPSPDSDYDVRFIYAHAPEWYIQLAPERDVIELPVNAVLDISGWDVRKAMQLANQGNSVIQEWLISPLVYQEDTARVLALRQLVASTFSAKATFHHYRAMATGMITALDEPTIKLKRFFYISRATLSALWVLQHHTMPTIVFPELLAALTDKAVMLQTFQHLIAEKAIKEEAEKTSIDPLCLTFIRDAYQTILALDINSLPAPRHSLDNTALRQYLAPL
ncbi:nucleotidyltransferase domain-containing protein [Thiofilum flexile]|uniref:nucleotidyltransferase domain-containing protein n=1 Tax=Thiofilum flexile TaxID=125627 RepID=UPI0003655FA7|nr:nucleotidyltransferase domain-containing protein [Thiofilum flexile]